MKALKNKLAFAVIAVSMLALPVLSIGTVAAIGEGNIEGGEIYRVRNVTKGGDFTDPVGATKCETLQYKVRIHNPGPSPITNVKVKANLPSTASTTNVSTITVSAADAFPTTTTDTATVNLTSSLQISYISGSTQLLDANGAAISTLPDGITTNGSGVDIGNVGVSIAQKRFVQFSAKVNCPVTPPPCEDNPNTPEDECNPVAPVTPETPVVPGTTTTPTGSAGVSELAQTGTGSIAGFVTAAILAGIAGFRFYLGRRFSS